jgi:hypothetical protein
MHFHGLRMRPGLSGFALLAALVASEAVADPQTNCADFRIGGAIRVYAQRVAPDGTTDPSWVPDPSSVCVAPGHEVAFSAAPAGGSAVVVAWTELGRDGSDIRAQRLEPGGGVTAGWPATGISVSSAAGDQNTPSAADDGGTLGYGS